MTLSAAEAALVELSAALERGLRRIDDPAWADRAWRRWEELRRRSPEAPAG